jgi:hypothetical protein
MRLQCIWYLHIFRQAGTQGLCFQQGADTISRGASVFVPSCRSAGDDMITCSWCTVLAKEILQSILLKLCMVSPSQEFNPILHGLTPPHPSTKPTNTANDQIQVHAFHLCHRILMYRRRTALKDTSIVVRLVCDERSQSLRRLGRPRRTNECPIQ